VKALDVVHSTVAVSATREILTIVTEFLRAGRDENLMTIPRLVEL